MKKKNVILIMCCIFSLTFYGCNAKSSSTEPETDTTDIANVTNTTEIIKEQPQTEQEEKEITKENKKDELTYTEHELFYALDTINFDNAEPIDMNSLLPDGRNMTLTDSVDIYGSKGAVIGYTKPNIDVHVVTSNENWYCFYFDAEEQGPYQYVLAKVSDVGGEGKVKNTEESYTKEEFFAKVKEVIAKKEEEEQKEFDEIYGENPNIDLPAYMLPRKTVEVNSKDGLIKGDAVHAPELYKSMCDGELGNIQNIASIIFSTYEQYYIEVTDETNGYVEFIVYGKPREYDEVSE